jgi:transposase
MIMTLIKAKTVIGLDIGKKYSWGEAVNVKSGKVLREEKLDNRPEVFKRFVKGLEKPILLVMEATGSWPYLYESWEDLVDEIQMAHPYKTKAIASAKIKTDKIDKHILAQLGMADLVPQAYAAPREVRDVREVLRHRAFLTLLQTRTKNRIHAYLWKLGILTEHTDLFGKTGLAWLETLDIRQPFRTLVDQDLRVLAALREEIKKATTMIQGLAKEDPRVSLLLPIQGLGKYSVLLILSEIGDIHRFPEPKKLVSFAGLCPSTHQSGAVSYHGHITKQGSKWLRWILVEAAQRYAKAPGRLGDLYRRISYRHGSKAARVAVAREMLTSIYHCLKKGVVFQENPQHQQKSHKKYFLKKVKVSSHARDLSRRADVSR